MGAQPTDKIERVRVAPHPLRKALEPAKGVRGVFVLAAAVNVTIDAVRVGPVRFDGYGIEASLHDQSLRDLRTQAVKLVGAMRRLAEQDEPSISDAVEKRVEVLGTSDQPMRTAAHVFDKRSHREESSALSWRQGPRRSHRPFRGQNGSVPALPTHARVTPHSPAVKLVR